jgi:hypothetical protein
MKTTFLTVLVIITASFAPRPLLAKAGAVMLMGVDDQAPLLSAIALELESLGFEVTVVPWDPRPVSNGDFMDAAEKNRVDAMIRVPGSPPEVAVWVADTETGRVIHRDVAVTEKTAVAPSQTAMAVAELLRASLFEVRAVSTTEEEASPESQDASETEAPAIRSQTENEVGNKALAASLRYRLQLELGGGVTAGTFEYPPTAHLSFGMQWRFFNGLGAVLFGQVPLTALKADHAAGKAALWHGITALGVRYTAPTLARRLQPWLEGGVGMVLARVEGEAEPGWTPNAATSVTAGLYVRGALAVVLHDRVHLLVGALLGRSFPGIDVLMDDEEVIEWGHVVFCGFLGVAMGFLKKKMSRKPASPDTTQHTRSNR